MGYVAVQGGITAIKNAEELTKYMRLRGKSIPLSVKQVQDQMRLLVDRVMGEGGLYSPFHASLAIKQAEGDPIEASFYLRAYRSTLPRLTESLSLETEEMRITRRISSAFKNIPGGQILGATTDYHQRMLDFSLLEEEESQVEEFLQKQEQEKTESTPSWGPFRKAVDILREQELVKPAPERVEEAIFDITQESPVFPAPRSARLQMLARSETGGILALAYSSMRGFGSVHPTIAELRAGFVPVNIPHPYRKNETLTIGSVEITEVEIVAKFAAEEKGEKPYFTLGYGICFGSNELKAISMAVLDRAMKEKEAQAPAQDQEFVLLHTDGIESSGFCSHFKLPHYITFQSTLDRLRSTQESMEKAKLTKEKRL